MKPGTHNTHKKTKAHLPGILLQYKQSWILKRKWKVSRDAPQKMSVSKKSHCLLSQTLPSSPPQALLPAYFLWNCWSTQAIKVHGGRRDAADEAHTGGAGASTSLTPLSPEPSEPSRSLLPPSDLTGWWWQEEELAFGIWVPQLLPTVWPWKTSLDLPKRLRFPICGIRITATTTPGPNTTIPMDT